MSHLPCLTCTNRKCRDPQHLADIDNLCKSLIDLCINAADITIPKVGKKKMIPNWNTEIKRLKEIANFWGNIWKDCGRPPNGCVLDIYRKCRHEYHYAIRKLRANETDMRKQNLAEHIASNNSRDLWKELNKLKSTSRVTAPQIDGCNSAPEINEVFHEKYKSLYNCAPSDLTSVYNHIAEGIENDCQDDFCVSLSVIDNVISRIKAEKSDGDAGLWSNLVIHAPAIWKSLLGELIGSMITHGHYAENILLSTILSLQKNAQKDACDSNNYRGIALTSCINKIVDWVVLLKYENNLKSSNLQFAYKEGHSTVMCTLAVKEVAKYYVSRKGQVYCAFLDATKAFDRVKFDKLFEILIERGIPICIIRLLLDMYTRQKVRTKWGDELSDTFTTCNGVRQGGVLSPVLFTLYMDVLFTRLQDSGYGCYIGHEFMGAMGYADDASILAPTLYAFKQMLKICECFGDEYGVTFNPPKTVCLHFTGKRSAAEPPGIVFHGQTLKWSYSCKHLGNYISKDLKEEAEIKLKRCDFIGRVNSLIANFKAVNRDICSRVFNAQCCHLYGCQAWALYDKSVAKFEVTWRKAVRKLWYLPYRARSELLPILVDRAPIMDQICSRFAGLYNGIMSGNNGKIKLLADISVSSEPKGIIGQNVTLVSKMWRCGHTMLTRDMFSEPCPEAQARALAIKELTKCLEASLEVPTFTIEDIKETLKEISLF